MKNLRLLLILLCISSPLYASTKHLNYYPIEYRTVFENLTLENKEMEDAIYKVIRRKHLKTADGSHILVDSCPAGTDKSYNRSCFYHQPLGYTKAKKTLFQQIDLKRDRKGYYLRDVYCHKIIRRLVGPKKLPVHTVINCEHSWPTSRFTRHDAGFQKSDLHHLFPADSKANSIRGNGIFGDIDEYYIAYGKCEDSHYGNSLQNADQTRLFEPPAEHKGDLARALFYFAVRYNANIDEFEEYFLRLWHEEDPVTREEIDRNTRIFEAQGNRNPFIDFPDLVYAIENF